MMRRPGILCVALAFAAPASAAPAHAGEPDLTPPAAGPARRDAATTGVVVSSSEELARVLEGRGGPPRILLEPRVYRGEFSIARPLELLGTSGTVLEGTGTGTVLTIKASDVVVGDVAVRHSGRRYTTEDAGIRATGERIHLRRVTVSDTLFGISLEQCHRCTVEGAHVEGLADEPMLRGDGIKLWESDDSVVRGSVVQDCRDIVVWYSRRATLDGNFVTRSRYGAHFMYSHDSVVRGMRVVDNVVGIFVMYSSRVRAEHNVLAGARGPAGMAIGFKDSDDVTLSNNWLVANTVGAYLDSTPRSPSASVTFEDNVVALNGVGIRLHASERGVVFRRNDFHENALLVEVEGGGDAQGVSFRNNYFSSYQGYDLDHDGLGDVPHEEKVLTSALVDERPALRLFRGTLAMGLLDVVARAVPVLASKRMFADESPATEPRRLVLR